MGIDNFNKFIVGATRYKGKFHTIIIDGSNFITRRTCSVHSELVKRHKIAKWNYSINMDPILQAKTIIQYTVKDCINTLNTLERKTKNIIIVFDPYTKPKYKVNSKIRIPFKEYEDVMILDLKSDTRNLRAKTAEKNLNKTEMMEKIDIEEDSEILKCIYNESVYFKENLAKLQNEIIYELMKVKKDITYIRAISEADFVIKNLAALNEPNTTLILSYDADYFVLLSDLKHAYVSEISYGSSIYNPYTLWKELLHEDITHDHIIRIATLCGNDYTMDGAKRITKLNFNNPEYIKMFLNTDKNFRNLLNTQLRNIKTMLKDSSLFPMEDLITPEQIDNLAFTDIAYADLYVNSVNAYYSWYDNGLFNYIELKTNMDKILNEIQNKFNPYYIWKRDMFNRIEPTYEQDIEEVNDIYEYCRNIEIYEDEDEDEILKLYNRMFKNKQELKEKRKKRINEFKESIVYYDFTTGDFD